VDNEGFDLLTSSLSKRFCSTEICGVSLDQLTIQFVFTNGLAEPIAQARAVAVAIVGIALLWRKFPKIAPWRLIASRTSELLDGANPNSVKLCGVPYLRLGSPLLSFLHHELRAKRWMDPHHHIRRSLALHSSCRRLL